MFCLRNNYGMDWVGVSETARALGVSEARVRMLLRQSRLRGRQISGVWVVDPSSVRERGTVPHSAGRTVSAAHAWAVLTASSVLARARNLGWADVIQATPVDRTAVRRLRVNLRAAPGPAEWSRWLTARAVTRRYGTGGSRVYQLVADSRVSLGGTRGLACSGNMSGPVGDVVDVYVHVGDVDAVVNAYTLVPDSAGPIVMRVVPEALPRELAPIPGQVAGVTACLVDLLDSPDAATAEAAAEQLGHVVDRLRQLTDREP